jgi:DNA-binding NarL/FixJ family response regulator
MSGCEPRVSVLIVQPREILRRGLRTLLGGRSDITVVAAVPDTRAADAVVDERRPAVVITDLVVSGRSATDWIRAVRLRSPGTRVLVLAAHRGGEHIREAFRSGAHGYVNKDSPPEELLAGVRAVSGGERYLCGVARANVVTQFVDAPRPRSAQDALHGVTPRERQVLALLAGRRPIPDIARTLSVDVRTVERHRANLLRKLALHSTAELRDHALHCGLGVAG